MNHSTRKHLTLFLSGLLLTSYAAGAETTAVVHPFVFKRVPKNTFKADLRELDIFFTSLVSAVIAVDTEASRQAFASLKRQDCDRSDECVGQLAAKAKALYGVYGEVDLDTSNMVTATGRVVRDDGVKVREAVVVKLPMGKEPYRDVVKVAITRLFEQLKVSQLPVAKPVEVVKTPEVVKAPEPVKVPEVKTAEVGMPPPMPPPVVEAKVEPSKAAPIGLLVGGAVVALAGGIIWGVGVSQVSPLNVNNGAVGGGRRDEATTKTIGSSEATQTVGAVALGVGAVAAASGLVWLLTQEKDVTKSTTITFGIAPTGNGGMASIQGSF
jgi:hypothetical protein